jgi:hypothetical protein
MNQEQGKESKVNDPSEQIWALIQDIRETIGVPLSLESRDFLLGRATGSMRLAVEYIGQLRQDYQKLQEYYDLTAQGLT